MNSNFHVKIIRGVQLLPMDFGQTSDPYCKLLLYPSTDTTIKSSFKTSVKKNTLQPEFNEEFVFQNIQLQDLIGKKLQITVFDKDVGKKDDYIGKHFIELHVCQRNKTREHFVPRIFLSTSIRLITVSPLASIRKNFS